MQGTWDKRHSRCTRVAVLTHRHTHARIHSHTQPHSSFGRYSATVIWSGRVASSRTAMRGGRATGWRWSAPQMRTRRSGPFAPLHGMALWYFLYRHDVHTYVSNTHTHAYTHRSIKVGLRIHRKLGVFDKTPGCGESEFERAVLFGVTGMYHQVEHTHMYTHAHMYATHTHPH